MDFNFNPAGGWPNRQPPPTNGEAKGCLLLVATVALTVAICICCGVVL